MSRKARCTALLSPFQIKQVKLRNRIVKSPQASGNATPEGAPTDGAFAYYESLAKGGAGLIVVEGAAVDFPIGAVGWPRLGFHEDGLIPLYSTLTNLIHDHGAKAFLELQHSGPSHPKAMSGLQPVAPSELSDDEKPVPLFDTARQLTVPEIKQIQLQFVEAAERAKRAGFDGVDVHGAHRYLINAFLSRAWNKRDDEYGCQDLRSRARFAVEILQAIRDRVGNDFPVGIRHNVAEWGLKGGITGEEGIAFAKMFEEAGADFLDVSGYGYGDFLWGYWGEQLRALEVAPAVKPWLKTIEDPGFIISQAAHIKKAVSIPVIGGGRIDPRVADKDVKRGKVDLVFFARRLIADPAFPNKLAEGRWEDIAPCTGCLECWDSTTVQHTSVKCRVNAASGREREFEITPAEKKKKVLVVGGGPGGMEAARIAALRGHQVTLCEKERKLGGLLHLAAMIKGSEVDDLPALVRYLETQLGKVGVTVQLGKEVTLSVAEELKPDAVVLAVGGVPAIPDIPGIENKMVVPASRLHRQSKAPLRFVGPRILGWLTRFWMPLGNRIVIIGGAMHGCELAEFLVRRGRKVTIVETSDTFGSGMVFIVAQRLIRWLKKKGVTMLSEVKYDEITANGLTITDKEGKKRTIEADNILIALPWSPNTELHETVERKFPEVYSIGDCREPNRVIHAIYDGSRIGRLI
ncbi:MAG: FAD-dependent oxidoreductase [Gemmatimonadota bacterium]|nr:MAG: FAD-dependent oxidoreductase [Gemmatimonadota bacterium]